MGKISFAIALAVLLVSSQGLRAVLLSDAAVTSAQGRGVGSHEGDQPPSLRESILKSAAAGDMAAVVSGILVAFDRSQEVFVVRRADDIETAAATFFRGEKSILYNSEALAQLRRVTDDEWGVVFLLAHEVMHHVVGHTTTAKPSAESYRAAELEVNELVGLVLRRLGASLEDAIGATVAACGLVKGSEADTTATVGAVQKGWRGVSRPPNSGLQPTARGATLCAPRLKPRR